MNIRLKDSDETFVPGKIVCIGKNYLDHAKEMGDDAPDSPVLFLKPSSALLADGGTVVIPPISIDPHHETELVVLVGERIHKARLNDVQRCIAGYGVGLDMTLRDVQSHAKKHGLPWALAKGFDTSAPVSEFLPAAQTTASDQFGLRLKVNGVTRQLGFTKDMIFSVNELLSYISQFITLERGDLVFTGTPEGVGRVQPGDHLEAALLDENGDALVELRVIIA